MPVPAGPDPPPLFRILAAGDGGIVVEFGAVVDVRLNRLVVALDARLQSEALPGVLETVPTYRSLLIVFDPSATDRKELVARLEALSAALKPEEDDGAKRLWHVPVSYGGRFGEDLDHVAALHGLSAEEVARHHSGGDYRVFMIGFTPGFAYLGGLPEILHTPRRTNPRARTPAGSISIGGVQAAVSSIVAPSGWHLLGQTPLRPFDLRRDDPFLLKPGDRIRFRPVSETEFERLKLLSDAGTLTADLEAT